MSRSRKHGVFAVSSDVIVLPSKNHETKSDSLSIISALDTVFQQIRIAGNHQRTIESYQYIFEQFVTINKLRYVDDITVESSICSRSIATRFKIIPY